MVPKLWLENNYYLLFIIVVTKLYGVKATIKMFVFILFCIVFCFILV